MRLTNFLLVAASALLVSCEAVSAATDSTQTKLSTMVSPNAVQSIDAATSDKRFLRTTKKEKHEDEDSDDDLDSEDDDDLDSEDEERMMKIPSFNKKAPRSVLSGGTEKQPRAEDLVQLGADIQSAKA
ncbi:hypothetical protein BBP00_00004295 [Phytophthora kernoviae]|uniref:RxLR effector protein n=1 Tax=Phytophthora kernoviae TaxID=325452 RepID=A0A3F2RT07_9STRA|nr:hypothetical protein BBP00_00004295 [Phytophthora kernoviae]